MRTPDNDSRAARLEEAIRRRKKTVNAHGSRLARRPPDQERYLGEMQLGIWLLQRLDPGSPAYHLTSAFRVLGTLDLTALERSLNAVVARHRLLRSTFHAAGDSVRQKVHQELPIQVERIDAGVAEALTAAAREASRPLDLAVGPLLRLLLIQEPEGAECFLVLVVHHLLADARSMGILWSELERHYAHRAVEASAERQYDDYACWARRHGAEHQAADLAFWRRKLNPLPRDLRLPFENSDLASPRRGRLLIRPFPPSLQQQTHFLAAAIGTTPFVVMAFVFRLLLHRYTAGREIAFATPVSTRSHPDTAEMIGYFLNPMIVYTPIDEDRTVEQSLREFSREMQECLEHVSIPFHMLVESLSPPRREDRHPLFQAMFVYRETTRPPRLGDTTLEPVALDLGASKFDLTLFTTVGNGKADLAIEYRADRFEPVWIEGLLRHYTVLLGQLDDGLATPTRDLRLLHPEESAALDRATQGASVETPTGPLLPQRIVQWSAKTPDASAIVGTGGDWTYGDLEQAAIGVAGSLLRQGVQPTDRVGLFLDRSPLMIAGVLGIHLAGAAYVPLDPADPPARTRMVLEDADVAAVVTRGALEQSLTDLSQPTILADALDAKEGETLEALPRLRPEHPAYILYTSGSTGQPKGVVVSHANLFASTTARPRVYDSRPERFLLLPSVSFDSSVAGIFWTLGEGGTLVLPSDAEIASPKQLAGLVSERDVTTLLCVPSLYSRLLDSGEDLLQTLETVIVAGERCPRQLVEAHFRRLPRTRLFNEYGPTEATVWATVHEFDRSDPGPRVPIGRPIPGVRLDVLDSLGRPVPAGIPGEAWISGPTVAQGYWRRPGLTAKQFHPGRAANRKDRRCFRTGDRMSWTTDGRLLFHGRLDDQIKLRGFRIEPAEVESALLRIPGVRDAAVVARDAAQLVAFVTSDRRLGPWREALATRLPWFMVPNRLVALSELPRLPSGKIDRKQLEEIDLEPEAPAEGRVPPGTDREKAVASLWESLLGLTGVGMTDNFFRIGGHSLLAVEMTTLLERDLGLSVEPAEVFQHPTIQELLANLERKTRNDVPTYAHLFPIQAGGDSEPFVFCVPHFFSEMVAGRFRGERPVFGLRGVSLRPEGNRGRWQTMEDLGEDLVDEITRRFPQQPIFMAGYSFGATMAVEAVRQMEARGLSVERLYLIAPMPVDFLHFGPFRLQIDALRRPVEELSLGQALWRVAKRSHPLTRRFRQRAWRLVAIQPWRRLLCLAGSLRKRLGLPLTPRILYADVRVERFRLHANYRPGLVNTPTVIFNATEAETDAAATWRPFFGGSLIVHQIPDPHLGDSSAHSAREVILRHLRDLTAR